MRRTLVLGIIVAMLALTAWHMDVAMLWFLF